MAHSLQLPSCKVRTAQYLKQRVDHTLSGSNGSGFGVSGALLPCVQWVSLHWPLWQKFRTKFNYDNVTDVYDPDIPVCAFHVTQPLTQMLKLTLWYGEVSHLHAVQMCVDRARACVCSRGEAMRAMCKSICFAYASSPHDAQAAARYRRRTAEWEGDSRKSHHRLVFTKCHSKWKVERVLGGGAYAPQLERPFGCGFFGHDNTDCLPEYQVSQWKTVSRVRPSPQTTKATLPLARGA